MMPPSGCTVASVLSPLQSSCRVGSSSPMETDLAVLGGLMVKTQLQNIMRITKSHHCVVFKLRGVPSQGGELKVGGHGGRSRSQRGTGAWRCSTQTVRYSSLLADQARPPTVAAVAVAATVFDRWSVNKYKYAGKLFLHKKYYKVHISVIIIFKSL